MFLVPLKVTVPPVLLDPPHANAAIRTAPHAAAQRSDLPVLDIAATSLCVLHQICPVSRGQNGTRPSKPQDTARSRSVTTWLKAHDQPPGQVRGRPYELKWRALAVL